MSDEAGRDDQTLIDFWDKAFAIPEEEKAAAQTAGPEDWKELAPSEKLFLAACSLGQKKKVLDYGCGSAWAGIIAAKSGCPDVTAVDPAPGAAGAAEWYAACFHAAEAVHAACVGTDWLQRAPAGLYDGVICSNVLDVVPPETAEAILRGLARAAAPEADVFIGLNYYLSPEAAAQKGLTLTDGNRLYINGVLRLVSRTDDEWAALFSPYFAVERLEHFAWPGETEERRRLFRLRKAR